MINAGRKFYARPKRTIDHENNLWTAGNGDGIIQKYSYDGRLLMQIGKRGVADTSDGTFTGRPMNASHTQLYMPSDIAVDPANGDVYVGLATAASPYSTGTESF